MSREFWKGLQSEELLSGGASFPSKALTLYLRSVQVTSRKRATRSPGDTKGSSNGPCSLFFF